jgi:hypothetical protein
VVPPIVRGMGEDALAGIDYPATKLEVIDTASDAGASQELVERLQQLEREQYESREQLEAELGD